MKILVTGGAGFIGSNFIRYLLNHHPAYTIINIDKLTYAGNLDNLKDVEGNHRYFFVRGDIADSECVTRIIDDGVDAIVNFAAESHVDRSIEDAGIFLKTNVLGTQVLLEAGRRKGIKRFIQVSTDEVYGSLGPEGSFTEDSPLKPNSPYAASKTAADLLVRAYHKTFGFPGIITRCSNNYGPYQFPEKLIPLFITNALAQEPLPLYGDGLNIRDWIQVEDHCQAIDLILHQGAIGEIYNIGGGAEKTNLELTRIILKKLNRPETLIRYVKDRPGHDRRYAIDPGKLKRELGWKPLYTFERGIEETIRWYGENRWWWEKIKSGEYREYYQRMYGKR
ncbi:MAG TPA: dTDP-glucose 4,6-dehydratase [Thermodesulfobacteriota bacterium]|nr:dTDP-glucose 4,6-dehydratase [Thermodesulfobacteriota bacterium]